MADTVVPEESGNMVRSWWQELGDRKQLDFLDAVSALGMGIGGPKALVPQALGALTMQLNAQDRQALGELDEENRKLRQSGEAVKGLLEARKSAIEGVVTTPTGQDTGKATTVDAPSSVPTGVGKATSQTTKTPAVDPEKIAIDMLLQKGPEELGRLNPQTLEIILNGLGGREAKALDVEKTKLEIENLNQKVESNKPVATANIGGVTVPVTAQDLITLEGQKGAEPAQLKLAGALMLADKSLDLKGALAFLNTQRTISIGQKVDETTQLTEARIAATNRATTASADFRNKIEKQVEEDEQYKTNALKIGLSKTSPEERQKLVEQNNALKNAALKTAVEANYPNSTITARRSKTTGEIWLFAIDPDGAETRIQRIFE